MIGLTSKILSLVELTERIEVLRKQGKTVALTNGAFDLLHVGHVRYLQEAAGFADILVVAVNDDESVERLKGLQRPIFPLEERMEMLAALEVVDFVVDFAQDDVGMIIKALLPDVQVKGTDYRPDTVPERKLVTAYGGRVAVAGDPKDHSTTEIIARLAGRK